jgi:biotin carboxyl carrier protein
MKLNVSIADGESDIDLRDEGRRIFAEIDGRAYELEVKETGSGNLLISQGRVFNCRVESVPESGRPVDVFVGPQRYSVTLIDPKRLGGASSAGAQGDGAARILAPMPGKVVRVLVAAGDQVEANAGLVVVEAMKMQNEMKSPKAGKIVSLKVEAGDTVNAGDVLAVVE